MVLRKSKSRAKADAEVEKFAVEVIKRRRLGDADMDVILRALERPTPETTAETLEEQARKRARQLERSERTIEEARARFANDPTSDGGGVGGDSDITEESANDPAASDPVIVSDREHLQRAIEIIAHELEPIERVVYVLSESKVTQREIAKIIGRTQGRVSQILKSALAKMERVTDPKIVGALSVLTAFIGSALVSAARAKTLHPLPPMVIRVWVPVVGTAICLFFLGFNPCMQASELPSEVVRLDSGRSSADAIVEDASTPSPLRDDSSGTATPNQEASDGGGAASADHSLEGHLLAPSRAISDEDTAKGATVQPALAAMDNVSEHHIVPPDPIYCGLIDTAIAEASTGFSSFEANDDIASSFSELAGLECKVFRRDGGDDRLLQCAFETSLEYGPEFNRMMMLVWTWQCLGETWRAGEVWLPADGKTGVEDGRLPAIYVRDDESGRILVGASGRVVDGMYRGALMVIASKRGSGE